MDQINIESGINDVTNMAKISALLMAQLTDTLHEAAEAGVSGKQAIETHEWLVDLVSFASLETKLKAGCRRGVGRNLGWRSLRGDQNLESSGVEASDWRPRHDEHYHEV